MNRVITKSIREGYYRVKLRFGCSSAIKFVPGAIKTIARSKLNKVK